MQVGFILWTMFMAFYIPLMAGVFEFIKYISLDVYYSFIIFCVMALGLIFIVLGICSKIIYWFDKIYEWDKQYKNLKKIR